MENTHSTIVDFLNNGTFHIALTAVVFAIFFIALALYLGLYARVASFRLMSKRPIREDEPGVSVVVPLFIDDSNYLETTLTKLLTQDYEQFEVVVAYVGNSEEFFNELKAMKNIYPHLSPTQIVSSPRYPVSVKTALNVGIKAAKYDYVVTTSYDAEPSSERWLSLMAKGFVYGDIVLGYSGIKPALGFTNFLIREYHLNNALSWLSSAIRGRAYAASRNTLGFKKSLYFDVRGFRHLDMNVGEDDLFVQQIATRDNVSVVLSPRATCTEQVWGDFSWWLRRVAELRKTHRFYPKGVLALTITELVVRAIFFAVAIVAIALLPWKFMLGVIAMVVARYLMVLFVFTRNANRLGESGLATRHFIYDFIEPLFRPFVAIAPTKQKQGWK